MSREFELKRLSHDAIPRAFQKAERYRLLNEPGAAESICRDILAVEPNNEKAKIALVLTLTDQFPRGIAGRMDEAWDVASTVEDAYDQAYLKGLVSERRAKTHYRQHTQQSGSLAYSWFKKAMGFFEDAAKISPPGNDSSLIRWNTCARFIMNRDEVCAFEHDDSAPPELLE